MATLGWLVFLGGLVLGQGATTDVSQFKGCYNNSINPVHIAGTIEYPGGGVHHSRSVWWEVEQFGGEK